MAETCTPSRAPVRKTSETMSGREDFQDSEPSGQNRLQMLWDEQMIDVDKTSPHQSISVMLIHWDEKLDDLHTVDEVNRLEKVLIEKYRFKVKKTPINGEDGKLPQAQLHKYLADFVFEEDGDRTLLIVYYAGHGVPGGKPGQMRLAGRRVPGKTEVDNRNNEIVWHTAEGIIDTTQADVLVIFDCCHAGNLARSFSQSRWSTRCFEFLGATSANSTTAVPGDSSFTSGLIWALDELSYDPRGFTTSELRRKIIEYPEFPLKQIPVLSERSGASLKHIVIAPLSPDGNAHNPGPEASPESGSEISTEYLDLRVLLKTRPNDVWVKSMSKFLSDAIRSQEFDARRVTLLGQYSRSSVSPSDVVNWWKQHTRRKKLENTSIIVPKPMTDLSSCLSSCLSSDLNPSLVSSPKECMDMHICQGPSVKRTGIRFHILMVFASILVAFSGFALSLKDMIHPRNE